MPTKADYEAAFDKERAIAYPAVDAFEKELGYFVPMAELEAAARILACPVKRNHPCWQHGRVLYAICRKYLAEHNLQKNRFLDIGTAKGFSALVMTWAARDAGMPNVRISSCDVLDPMESLYRNSILDVDGPSTLAQYLAPWPETQGIGFHHSTGIDYLKRCSTGYAKVRINLAFVDGKHSTEVVAEEASMISALQHSGDVILFDDLQMKPVRAAVGRLTGYNMREIKAAKDRTYMWAVKI